jgi:hypothetical protein
MLSDEQVGEPEVDPLGGEGSRGGGGASSVMRSEMISSIVVPGQRSLDPTDSDPLVRSGWGVSVGGSGCSGEGVGGGGGFWMLLVLSLHAPPSSSSR